jgi:hypothetical protein
VECASFLGTPVRLDGSGSSDPDGTVLTYHWSGDFGEADGASPAVTLSLGVHTITLQVTDSAGATDRDEVVITVQDTRAPLVRCVAGTNPAGAGTASPSGFYRLLAVDACTSHLLIAVSDTAGSGPFGPFASGSVVKLTQTPGGKAKVASMGSPQGAAGAISAHIFLPGDPMVGARDGSGNTATVSCPVPPRNK